MVTSVRTPGCGLPLYLNDYPSEQFRTFSASLLDAPKLCTFHIDASRKTPRIEYARNA